MSDLRLIYKRDAFPISKRAFILMPFHSDYASVHTEVIRPELEAAGFEPMRGDDLYSDRTVIRDIWRGIQEADLIVADLGERNPNVMYELGLAHALWRKTILLTRHIGNIPFDLRALRFIAYDPKDLEKLKRDFAHALSSMEGFITEDPTLEDRASFLQDHVFFSNSIDATAYAWKNMIAECTQELHLFGPTLSMWFNNPEARSALIAHVAKGRRLKIKLSTWEPLVAFGGSGTVDLKRTIDKVIQLWPPELRYEGGLVSVRFNLSVSTLSGVITDPDTGLGRAVLTMRLADEHNSSGRFVIGIRAKEQPFLFADVTRKLFNVEYLGEDLSPEQMLETGRDKGYIS